MAGTKRKAAGETELAADEATQYDRQIRLWGVDAQKRIRACSMLVVGARGLAVEVCKNVVLAGISHLTLWDPALVSEHDLGAQFFLGTADIGKNRAKVSLPHIQALNPMVEVVADDSALDSKPDAFFDAFDLVCVTACSLQTMVRFNNICRAKKIQFFAGDVHGYFGFFFTDLLHHHFLEEQKTQDRNTSEEVVVKKQGDLTFCSMAEAFSTTWAGKAVKRVPRLLFGLYVLDEYNKTHGRSPGPTTSSDDLELARRAAETRLSVAPGTISADFIRLLAANCSCELGPVAAVVGGILGSEIIKAISGKDEPLKNCFLYDGLETTGLVECLAPEEKKAAPPNQATVVQEAVEVL
eukprot:m.92439 g.92439  ORF g.92439 m.92439 type:complete len:353 (+) comp15332_c1_seq1:31-1089(+)